MHAPVLQKQDLSRVFDADYYATGLGLPYERNDRWLNFFGLIADEIVRALRPRTAFDAGCAMGMLVESLWDRGVEAYGLDISSYAISQVRRDIQPYCREGSLFEPIGRCYDLVVCIEVLEHLSPDQTETVIANLAAAADTILFSSSPTDLREPTHFNIRPVISWLKLFANAGFSPDYVFDASFVAPHAILLRKQAPLSEDVLQLFSEKTRLKCALVEREQRIGRLDQKIAELSAEAGLRDELERARRELNALRDESERVSLQLDSLRADNRRLSSEHMAVRDENRRIASERLAFSNELQLVRGENQRVSGELTRRQADAVKLLNELRASHVHTESLENDLAISRVEIGRLQAEIDHVNRSAAWQFTKRYRAWIDRRRNKSAFVRACDKTAKWLVGRTRFAVRKSHAPVSPTNVSHGDDGGDGLDAGAADIESSPEEQASPRGPDSGSAHLGTKSAAVDQSATPPEPASTNSTSLPLTKEAPSEATPTGLTLAFADEAAIKYESYESWYSRTEPGPELLKLQRILARNLRLQPLISVLVPVYSVPIRVLQEMVESVVSQTYHNWELCIAHSYPQDIEGREYLASLAATDPRIKVRLLNANHGISGNSNIALECVQGDFVALLDHDDTLAPFALFQMATAINEHPEAGLFYSDKDCITDDGGQRLRPFLKPQWSPDTMLSANYLTHLTVMRTSVVREVNGWKTETDGAQDWDIFLRVIDTGVEVVHVPGVLYHWRLISTSVASSGLNAKPYASEAQRRTIDAHAERRDLAVAANVDRIGICKVDWSTPEPHSVSVIVISNSGDASVPEGWVQRLAMLPEAYEVEIIVVTTGSFELGDRVRTVIGEQGNSVDALLNRAAEQARGQYLVFLDESIADAGNDWLRELVGPLTIPHVAAVAPKLLDPETYQIRHAGLVFNFDGRVDYVFSNYHENASEQAGATTWYRNWSAVAGGCLAVRRDAFERVGGFQQEPEYPRHDVDLCLRLRISGYRIVMNPFAGLFQRRSSVLEQWLSPSGPQAGAAYFRQCFPLGDPYFHPQLESRSGKLLFAADSGAVPVEDFANSARVLAGIIDADSELIHASKAVIAGPRTNNVQNLTWVLPEFHHAFYGGVHTILRFADYFRRSHQVRSEFVFTGRTPERLMRSRIAEAFPELAANCYTTQLRSYADWNRVNESDATICTLWTTAYAALHFKNTRRKFYFIQDYESLFYPAGSIYALVEASYRFGYIGICNTQPLQKMYEEFGGIAEFFDPCIDSTQFFVSNRAGKEHPFLIFCYARPGHPRNCFELLSAALSKLKQRMGDQVRVVSAGAEWNPSAYGLDGVIENLGLLSYSSTGALYRSCDAGVVMMMTRHPSYLPFELMACGALVITNDNRYTSWFLKHQENCLLSEPTSGAIAEAIQRGLCGERLRTAIVSRAAAQIRAKHSDWDSQAEKIYTYLVSNS